MNELATQAPDASTIEDSAPAAEQIRRGARLTMQRQILGLAAGLNVASTILACTIAFYFQKTAFLHGIDRLLTNGAIAAQQVYGDEFQRDVLAGKPISQEEEYAHMLRISNLVERLGLNYISAVVRRDGKYFFTVSSSTPEELQDGTYDRVWQPYEASPALAAAFEDGKTSFEDHENRYGDFRSAYVPYRLPGSQQVDYVYVADIGMDYIDGHLLATLAKTAFACLVICGISMWLTWMLSRHIAGPMAKLARLIRSVVHRDFRLAPDERTALHGVVKNCYQEAAEVGAAFCRMEDQLQEHIRELQRSTAERERIASELSIAHEIQMGLLPRKLPELPGCDVFARVIPAKEVGGDLFEVADLGQGRLLLMVADVSGKGVSAGMFMAVTKTLLDASRTNYTEPEEIVRFLNDVLSQENEACMFVTMFLAILDTHTGQLRYTNGGHNPPYVLHENGRLTSLTERHGMALGIAPGQQYGADVVTLEPGDLLLLYSDGVTEAQNAAATLFSEERLESCLCAMTEARANEAGQAIIDHVYEFQGDAPQFDDITLVTLRYTVSSPAALALA